MRHLGLQVGRWLADHRRATPTNVIGRVAMQGRSPEKGPCGRKNMCHLTARDSPPSNLNMKHGMGEGNPAPPRIVCLAPARQCPPPERHIEGLRPTGSHDRWRPTPTGKLLDRARAAGSLDAWAGAVRWEGRAVEAGLGRKARLGTTDCERQRERLGPPFFSTTPLPPRGRGRWGYGGSREHKVCRGRSPGKGTTCQTTSTGSHRRRVGWASLFSVGKS